MLKQTFILSILLSCCLSTSKIYGQLSVGAGLAGGFPFSLNKEGYYNQLPMGLYATISYQPANTVLYPSFTYVLSHAQLPVFNDYYNDWNVLAQYQSYMLNLNYNIEGGVKGFSLFGGLGITEIKPHNTIYINAQSTSDVQLIDKGNVNIYPAINIGAKYSYKISKTYQIYLGIDANITYIYMHNSNNEYSLRSAYSLVPASIGGDVLNPCFAVSINYVFGEQEEY